MRHLFVIGLVLVSLTMFINVDSTLLKAVALKSLALLGPLKIALLPKTVLGLAIANTVMNARQLRILRNLESYYGLEDYDKDAYDDSDSLYESGTIYSSGSSYGPVSSYGSGGGSSYGQSSYGGSAYRRRRSVTLDNEEAFEWVGQSDSSRCTERLLCHLAEKMTTNPTNLHRDEWAIIAVVSQESPGQQKSKAHQRFQNALLKGSKGSDCTSLYTTCPYTGEQMMAIIRVFGTGIEKESPEAIHNFIRS